MTRTYYDILDVEITATRAQLNDAKNKLARKYHPDVHMSEGIDTTEKMQEILEAYAVLSDPEKRARYDAGLAAIPGAMGGERHFHNFDLSNDEQNTIDEEAPLSFVAQWKCVMQLYDLLEEAENLMHGENERIKKRGPGVGRLLDFLRSLLGRRKRKMEKQREADRLRGTIRGLVDALDMAQIQPLCRHPYVMNWVLLRWSNRQDQDYHILLNKFEYAYFPQMSDREQKKLRREVKQMQRCVDKLLKDR